MSTRGRATLIAAAVALSWINVSCVSRTAYVVTLKDGRRIETAGWPTLNEVTGYYRVEDRTGNYRLFREQEVASIVTVKQGES